MPLRSLSAPVAFFCLDKGEPVVESLTDSFASALGLEVTSDHVDETVHRLSVVSLFGEGAVVPFRECLEGAIAGQLVSRRIPIIHSGKSSSRIFMFHPGESEHAGGSCLVALERRSRSTLPVMAGENSAQHLAALNGQMFFTYDLKTTGSHYLNPVMSGVLDLPATGLDARHLMRRLHGGDITAFRTCIDALPNLAEGQVLTLTIRLRDRNRKWRSLLVRIGVASRDAHGELKELIGVAEDFTDHQALSGALESTAQHVHDIEVRERRRIARELHDSTAQHLVAIDLGLSSLPIRPDEAHIITDIRSALKTAQKEIRNFSYLLHPPQVAENGLKAALTSFLEGFGSRASLRIETTFAGMPETIPPATGRVLFRIAQEALMNVHRHSGASQVSVSLKAENNIASMDISDNGNGLAANAKSGVGFSGMKARLDQIGGSVTFASGEKGFHLHAECPFQPESTGKE
jgi:signal transduction histidine kinase